MTLISDEFLLAYLDGQLEAGQSRSVTQMAAANAEIARRLVRLKRTQSFLMETFGAFARDTAISPPSQPPFFDQGFADGADQGVSYEPRKRAVGGRRKTLTIALLGLGLAAGYAGNAYLTRPVQTVQKIQDRQLPVLSPVAAWTNDVARFHSFFVKESLTSHLDAISNSDLIRLQLQKAAGKAISPPDFSRQGYTLFRGQMFLYNQERMMQLTYTSPADPPLALYVLPAPRLADTPMAIHSFGASKGVSWIDDRVRYLLIADKRDDDLKVLAVLAQHQMRKK